MFIYTKGHQMCKVNFNVYVRPLTSICIVKESIIVDVLLMGK